MADTYEATLRADIASCDDRLGELRDEISTLTVRRETLDHALTLYRRTRAGADDFGIRRVGPYTATILKILREAGLRGLTTQELYRRIEEAGQEVRHPNIRSLLYERKRAGVLERLDDGRYRFVPSSISDAHHQDAEASAAATADASLESREGNLLS